MKKLLICLLLLIPSVAFSADTFNAATGELYIPNVSVSGTVYEVTMQYQENLAFQLRSAEPASKNNLIVGVWSYISGVDFSYFVFLPNGTFLYAEYDSTVLNPETENGLEVGTYSFEPTTDQMTFVIQYDDNAPGQDSGVGDGTTAKTMILSSDGQTLTLEDPEGSLAFTKSI